MGSYLVAGELLVHKDGGSHVGEDLLQSTQGVRLATIPAIKLHTHGDGQSRVRRQNVE